MSVTSRYREAWEGFWGEAPEEQGAVFWDAEPALTAGVHLSLFEPYLVDPGLPMVDLGCGNGTQTRFLASRFRHVVGADISAAALDHARRADPAGQAGYRQLDAVEKAEIQALHTELGDANVYMRGTEGPPSKLAPVLKHGIAPGEVADEAVPEYLHAAGLTLLARGELSLLTTEQAPDGSRVELPSKWVVAGRAV